MLVCIFSLLVFHYARAQSKTVTGTVLDDKGAPLVGATVKIKGSQDAVSTDGTGKFSLSAPASAKELEVSYVGYETRTVPISSDIRVSMVSTRSNMDEVVVVGYGTQRRKDVTGSMASVKGGAIKDLPV